MKTTSSTYQKQNLSQKSINLKRARNAFLIISFICLALFAIFLASLILKSHNGGVDNNLGYDLTKAEDIKQFFIILANIIDKDTLYAPCPHFNLKLVVLGLGGMSLIFFILGLVMTKKFLGSLVLTPAQEARARFYLQKYEYKLMCKAANKQAKKL